MTTLVAVTGVLLANPPSYRRREFPGMSMVKDFAEIMEEIPLSSIRRPPIVMIVLVAGVLLASPPSYRRQESHRTDMFKDSVEVTEEAPGTIKGILETAATGTIIPIILLPLEAKATGIKGTMEVTATGIIPVILLLK